MMGRIFDEHIADYAKILSQFESNDKSKLGIIYIEDITDKQFWQKIATKHEVKLYSENGSTITGKSKLLQICNQNQLIAIDSDFDYLCPNYRDESILFHNNSSFILQTYTHGRENITYSPECLHRILENKFQLYLENHYNPILDIFNELSKIWFEPYCKLLFLLNNKYHQISHDDWINTIKFSNQECQDIALKQDFSSYKDRISKFHNQLNQCTQNQNDFLKFCNELEQKNFTNHTVWAFIRCHDFENKFVEPLIKEIIKSRQSKELGDIDSQYSKNEIGNRKSEIINYFKEVNHIKTILHHYFYDTYFDVAKNSNIFLAKIIQDYQYIIQ
ncbi:DUF4435 domain-containing protein [Moraxella oblonga]|uniref:DUF4435 domain-containing protein n=1 Tax=Moraxella oblonga TaxID=200413 RepID=UPI00082CAAAB|nr:DUF4435 domain-containing protein [Moraxella oblonga]